jgi:hypothetical protein
VTVHAQLDPACTGIAVDAAVADTFTLVCAGVMVQFAPVGAVGDDPPPHADTMNGTKTNASKRRRMRGASGLPG